MEVDSAGLDREAEIPLSSEAIEWADIIFVMEKSHRSKLSRNFQPWLKHKRVICLDIPDEYEYMEPALVQLLKKKVLPLLGTFRRDLASLSNNSNAHRLYRGYLLSV
jgi:predicted protein tyrosine phosphatase